jgi:hypothetical protein
VVSARTTRPRGCGGFESGVLSRFVDPARLRGLRQRGAGLQPSRAQPVVKVGREAERGVELTNAIPQALAAQNTAGCTSEPVLPTLLIGTELGNRSTASIAS